MTKIRFLFLLQRATAYLVVLGWMWRGHTLHSALVWVVAVVLAAWGSGDQWKRPDASPSLIRRGAWVEVAVILALVPLFHDSAPGFLFISPLARVCIHAGWSTALAVGFVSVASALASRLWIQSPLWITIAQIVAFLTVIVYAGIMGELVRVEIAQKLHLCEGTVKNYVSALYAKLGIRQRSDVIRFAREKGIF